jgi:tetratricopeptide (TPR) repeat protein
VDLDLAMPVTTTAQPEAMIDIGRRHAYLWRYGQAIDWFTRGIARYPGDARMYRHRGHRDITTRQFDRARADLEKAATLIRGTADQVEPDGAANPSGIPRSTLHFNVWYHLGLTYYLQGEYAKALEAYRACLAVSKNGAYHRRLLMYKGLEKPETMLEGASSDATTLAAQGYGVGNYYLVTGDIVRARRVFEQVASGSGWNAFGYIAAEADLARMK